MQNQQTILATGLNNAAELDLKLYVRIIWRWAWLLILCTVIAGATAYIVSFYSIPIYQATVTVMIDIARNPALDYSTLQASQSSAHTYAELMKDKALLDKVAIAINVKPDVLRGAITNITITPVRDTQLLQIDVEGTAPEALAVVAAELPRIFNDEINARQAQRYEESKSSLKSQLDVLQEQIELTQVDIDKIRESHTAEEEVQLEQLRNQMAQYQSSYTTLCQSYEALRLAEIQSTDTILLTRAPETPTDPIRPRILINMLLAAIVGGMLALGIVFLVEYLDDRIKTPEALNRMIDLPILGVIAKIPQKAKQSEKNGELSPKPTFITNTEPRHPITEAYRGLRTNLRFSSIDMALSTILVTSANPSEGKTTTAGNLAIVVAQSGRTVILVDADMRKPQQHIQFRLPQNPGLTDALLIDEPLPESFLHKTEISNLQVLTCGQDAPNPSELLGSKRMQLLIQQLRNLADVIIFDAPPVLPVTDAQVLAEQMQGVLLVVNTQATKRASLIHALEALLHNDAHLLGVVLNRMTYSDRGYYYGQQPYYATNHSYNRQQKDKDIPQVSQQTKDGQKVFDGNFIPSSTP